MTTTTATEDLPVVVIGAGPIGLAAAAHLTDRGLPFVVLEAGEDVGTAVSQWAHIRTFTPWQYIADPTAEKLLAPTGWTRPTTPVPPTGAELVEHYLRPLGGLFAEHMRFGERVVAVSRDGMDKTRSIGRSERPFVVRVERHDGVVGQLRARAVIDASGTWSGRNPLGGAGLPAVGEEEAAPFLVGPLPDVLDRGRDRFAGRRTLVVGAGHSAANTLLNLARLSAEAPGTEIVWAIRGTSPAKVYGGAEADELAARGRLGADLRTLVESGALRLVTGFATTALEPTADTVTVVGETPDGEVRIAGVHNVAAATGFRPDLAILSEVRLDLDPGLEAPRALGPLIDPAFHSCGTVPPHGHRDLAQPEEGLYIVGMKSYGRAPTFLITTGNEQVRSVVAALAGDRAAADEVQLVLPETGVCSVNAAGQDTGAGGCCGTPTGVDGLEVPAEAHRARPDGVPAQGFTTGVAGGGAVALLALTDVTPTGDAGSCGSGGCCS
ncbi:NAD(P)-binding domain-containing protein [Actinotalea ferrariae]|uniref:NAD(P)-binding domain-containing protein n=1 Tax=Actinotalea ferrariae TaxID=1386098 RepID=UPI001C8C7705|nr:NAD(P)-binding domain-containing protein [Actinotalea ferrariae]MBX9243826.1 NAD(P)-binding domain-containing protein [Actinotalea ferrariae]